MGKLYSVDIDGILCKVTDYKQQLTAQPILDNITKVNKLYDDGQIIILHTARREADRSITIHWLAKNNVKYHAIVMGKLKADIYIDDKNGQL